MRVIKTIRELRAWRKGRKDVAFVPTMGNLHDGHMALIKAAKARADAVVVSIFVNRLQFGQGEDFDAYPRTLKADSEKLEAAGVSVLFAPDDEELYPRGGQECHVEPSTLQNELCGIYRPGHFRGVATVVLKLFNIVQPDIACFGKKDYQQLTIIRQMVEDLNLNVMIVPVDIGRADDGLALSSRNSYLSAEERQRAPQLFRAISGVVKALEKGTTQYADLEKAATKRLTDLGWKVDYLEIRRSEDLQQARPGDNNLIVLAAAYMGKTRLIDNLEVTLPSR